MGPTIWSCEVPLTLCCANFFYKTNLKTLSCKTMHSKITYLCYKLMNLLLVANLLNYSSERKSLTKKQIILVILVTFCYFLNNLVEIYFATLHFDFTIQIPVIYGCVLMAMHTFGSGLFYLWILRQRCELFAIMCRSETVLKGLNPSYDQHLTKRRVFSTLKITMVILYLL